VAKGREPHSKTVDATSLFDAADEVIQDWNRLWWWSSSSLIQIESGPDRWQVNQATVGKGKKPSAAATPELPTDPDAVKIEWGAESTE
jgi:hypothetical protein